MAKPAGPSGSAGFAFARGASALLRQRHVGGGDVNISSARCLPDSHIEQTVGSRWHQARPPGSWIVRLKRLGGASAEGFTPAARCGCSTRLLDAAARRGCSTGIFPAASAHQRRSQSRFVASTLPGPPCVANTGCCLPIRLAAADDDADLSLVARPITSLVGVVHEELTFAQSIPTMRLSLDDHPTEAATELTRLIIGNRARGSIDRARHARSPGAALRQREWARPTSDRLVEPACVMYRPRRCVTGESGWLKSA